MKREGKGERKKVEYMETRESRSPVGKEVCRCVIPHEENPCAIVLEEVFAKKVSSMQMVFRIRPGTSQPLNADGRMAWTTAETRIDRHRCEIRLAYRIKDNPAVKEDYFAISSIEPCKPGVRDDKAVILYGEDKWKVVYTSHTEKKGKEKVGFYCKEDMKQKRKSTKLYKVDQVTKVRGIGEETL